MGSIRIESKEKMKNVASPVKTSMSKEFLYGLASRSQAKSALIATLSSLDSFTKLPTALNAVIEEYVFQKDSIDFKGEIKKCREAKFTPDAIHHLSTKIIEGFCDPDSQVAFVFEFLTKEEQALLQNSKNFPRLLKLYYLPISDFTLAIRSSLYQDVESALLYSLSAEVINSNLDTVLQEKLRPYTQDGEKKLDW